MSIECVEVLNNVLGSSDEDFNYILQLLKDVQNFNSSNVGDIISHISNLLGQHATRVKGLLLVSTILETSYGHKILDKTSTYIPLCIAVLKSPSEQALGFSVLKQFLEKYSTVHELERSVINPYLPDLLQSLSKCTNQSKIQALLMLETLLHKFSKACGTHKSIIEKFLVPFIDSKDKKLVMYAAKCTHLLQQVRGGGEQGMNHKIAWINQFNLLLKSIVKAISHLYSADHTNVTEDNETVLSSNVGPLQVCLEELDDLIALSGATDNCNPVTMKALRLTTRLENLFTFLQAMIVEPFPVSKKMNCKHILEILMKCLSAVCGNPCASKTESILHCSIMNTLRALCVSLKGDILPYFTIVLRMILQTLEWSRSQIDEADENNIKPFINVRKAAYNSLCSVLKCVHSCKPPVQRGDLNVEDTLLENIISDICPKMNTVQLTMTNVGGPKPMNKKERRRNAMAVNALGMPDNIGQPSKRTKWCSNNLEIIIAAIECLQAIYVCMGNFLKPNSHKLTQESIVGLFYDSETPTDVKKKLCAVLSSLMNFTSSSQPSIAAHCLYLYSSMQHDANTQLSWISQQALRSHLSSARGYAPPLQFPVTSSSSADTLLGRQTSTSFKANNSTTMADDVIEIGVIPSSSEESQDHMISDTSMSNKKKRKRSADVETTLIQNKQSTDKPEKKRAKVIINPEASVEISDSSDSSHGEENLSRESNPSPNLNVKESSKIEERHRDVTINNSSDDVNLMSNTVIVSDSVIANDDTFVEENLRFEIVNKKTEDSFNEDPLRDKHNDTVLSNDDESGHKKITMEEMMGTFVDDVNEELK